MSIHVSPNYKSGEFSFPSRDIDPKTKGADYSRQWAEAIYALFCKGKTAWTTDAQNEFTVLRAYSRGEQDMEQYKKWLMSSTTTDTGTVTYTEFDDLPISRVAKREGWYNILWQNISPAPMVMSAIHGMFDKADYDLFVDTIDADSRKLAEEQKYLKLIESQNLAWQNKIKMDMGIPIDETMVYPKSKEELDMYEAQGGFKLNVARAMQKILRHTFEISEWSTETFEKVLDDFVCIEYGAVEDYFDSEDSKFKSRYLDPARLVIQFSNKYDYSDAEYAGYVTNWTVSNLRNKLPNVSEDELYQLAKQVSNKYGNPILGTGDRYSLLDPTTNTYSYDGFKVPVMHAWWMDTDTNKKLYYKSFRGRESIYDLGWNSEVKPISERQAKAGATQTLKHIYKRVPRECYWVMDSKHVFDFGPIRMASRERLSKPQLPVHAGQLLQPSLMKRMRPVIDQITQTFLRHQNSLAMMVENGVAVNTTMLGNVTLGGGKLKPAEVLKLGKETGFWLYSYAPGTGMYSGGAATPITPIKGGMGERVKETMDTFDLLFRLFEKITGINPVSMGASPDPNAPVGTTQAALQATTNVLKPYMDACYELKKSVGTCMMRRIQVGIRNNDLIRQAYVGIISPSDMDALKMMESEGVQYGFSLKAKPDMKQKLRFEKWIDIALQNTREQRPGIDLNDAVWFMSQLENGADLMDLEAQLEYAIEKNKQEAAQQSQKMIEAQGQQNMQNEQVKAQVEQARIQEEAKAKINEEIIRGKVKANQTKLEGNLALLEATRQAMEVEQGLQPITNR
jgi:hypothetical protein